MAAHGRAVLAVSEDEDDAESWFEQALALHADSVRPFERARTQLAYGEHLRRQRRRVDARVHLRAALETFEDLKALPWADRAAQELRASGESARKRDQATELELTPTELQVAQLVQQGLSNREVAAQLFVSPRTVDFHLRNVFAKTGITLPWRAHPAVADVTPARRLGRRAGVTSGISAGGRGHRPRCRPSSARRPSARAVRAGERRPRRTHPGGRRPARPGW